MSVNFEVSDDGEFLLGHGPLSLMVPRSVVRDSILLLTSWETQAGSYQLGSAFVLQEPFVFGFHLEDRGSFLLNLDEASADMVLHELLASFKRMMAEADKKTESPTEEVRDQNEPT